MADNPRVGGVFDPGVWRGRLFLSAIEDSTGHMSFQSMQMEWRDDGSYIIRPYDRGVFPVTIGSDDGIVRVILGGQIGPRLLRKAS